MLREEQGKTKMERDRNGIKREQWKNEIMP